MRVALVTTIAACAALTACATSGEPMRGNPETTIINTATGEDVRLRDPSERIGSVVTGSAAQLWQKMPAVYQQFGLGGRVFDERARVYGNERVVGTRINNRPLDFYLRCGTEGTVAGFATRWRAQFSITTWITEVGPERSEVATHIMASAKPTEGTSTNEVLCVSTGKLEQEIAAAFAR